MPVPPRRRSTREAVTGGRRGLAAGTPPNRPRTPAWRAARLRLLGGFVACLPFEQGWLEEAGWHVELAPQRAAGGRPESGVAEIDAKQVPFTRGFPQGGMGLAPKSKASPKVSPARRLQCYLDTTVRTSG